MTDTHMLNSPEQIAAWERVHAKFKDAGWTVADSANFRLMFGWGYRAGMAELEEQNRQLVQALREATEAPAFDPESNALATWEAEKASEQPTTNIVKTAPERIWLNLFTTDEDTDGELLFPADHEGITWADSEVGDHDVPYVRADLSKASEQQAERKPLTDSYIDHSDTGALHVMAPRGRDSVREFARRIERAHGIGVKLSSQEGAGT